MARVLAILRLRLAAPLFCLAALPLAALGQTGGSGLFPPLRVQVLDAAQRPAGTARVYFNYVELEDATGRDWGAIGVMWQQGRYRLFVVKADRERRLIGRAENHRLFDAEGKLKGFYYWTPTWSYVFDPDMKKVGQARCLAYQGVCAAGIAGFLLGLE